MGRRDAAAWTRVPCAEHPAILFLTPLYHPAYTLHNDGTRCVPLGQVVAPLSHSGMERICDGWSSVTEGQESTRVQYPRIRPASRCAACVNFPARIGQTTRYPGPRRPKTCGGTWGHNGGVIG